MYPNNYSLEIFDDYYCFKHNFWLQSVLQNNSLDLANRQLR